MRSSELVHVADVPDAPAVASASVSAATHATVNARLGPRPASHFWSNAAGRLHRFTIHDFVFCPAPAKAAFVLVRREAATPTPLYAGAAFSASPTANLARIRRIGARLGANEVHLLELGADRGADHGRKLVRGLRAGLARM